MTLKTAGEYASGLGVSAEEYEERRQAAIDSTPTKAVGYSEHRPATFFLPRELDGIRPEIIRHVDAMIYKLRKNKHKGSIDEWDLEAAFVKLEAEVKELRQAIDEGSPVEIIMESADVSNMALILAAIGIKKVNHS